MASLFKAVQSIVLLLAGTIVMGSCGPSETAVEAGNRAQILHLGNSTDPQDLDPHVVTGVPEYTIISALLEGLVAEDPHDLHPVPGAAARWEKDETGTIYTFSLQENGRWSNGEPVTAHDFVYSFQRILSPGLGSEYAYMLFCMRNARAYHEGAVADFSDVGVRAVDDHTLIIVLERPVPCFLSLLTHHSWFPVHQATIEQHGAMDQRGSRWTRPEHYVGNGPFVLKAWEVNRVIIVEKSPTYWDAPTVRLKAIHFYPIESAQTEERAFRSGQLHVTQDVPLNKIDFYKQEHPELIHIDSYLGTYYYLINVTRPPLDNPQVRKALAYAVDRESLVRNVLKGVRSPARHFTPPDTAGYTAKDQVFFDPQRARQLLREAGWPDGAALGPVEILYNTSESHLKVAEAIQQMWKQHLNISATLVNQEWKVFLESQQRGDYQIARGGWIGDYLDPATFLDLWVTEGGNNRTGWSNTGYDRLIHEASARGDGKERMALFQQAESILLDEMPIIPIYFYTSLSLIQPSVKGWHATILDHHPYKHVYLEAE